MYIQPFCFDRVHIGSIRSHIFVRVRMHVKIYNYNIVPLTLARPVVIVWSFSFDRVRLESICTLLGSSTHGKRVAGFGF